MNVLKKVGISILIILGLDFLSGYIIIPDSYQSFRTKHYYYHHGLLPNRSDLAAWGSLVYPVHTNSLSFVDSTVYKVPLESSSKRILIIGDSHSEGVGVPYLRTFAGRLAERLKEKNTEVFNASCISYSPKIEYLKVKYLIEKEGFIPDHIFLLIDISDLQNELVYEGFNPGEDFSALKGIGQRLSSFVSSHFSIYYLVSSIIRNSRQQEFIETAELFDESRIETGNLNTIGLYSEFFSHFDDNTLLSNPQFHGVGEWYYDEEFRVLADKGIDLAQKHILKLRDLCQAHDIELTISVHPWHPQIFRGNAEDYYVKRWKSFAAENRISFVNLFPLFINEQNPVLVRDLYYIKGDNHWNEFGHKLVADSLESFFLSKIENK